MTMRMAELILNDTVQCYRHDEIARIKSQLDAEHVRIAARDGKSPERLDPKTLISISGSF